MAAALPEPEQEPTAHLRVVRSGEPTASPGPSSPPSPIEPASSGAGFMIGWTLFRLTVWAAIAVWVYPPLLGWVGGDQLARWLLDHGWVRLLGVPPLGLLTLISAFEVTPAPRRRAAREDLARRTGATLVEPHGADLASGFPKGPGARVPLGRWSMEVGTWIHKGHTFTVASVRVESRSTFSFAARGPDREPEMLRGLQQFALAHAVRQMARRAKDARAAAAAAAFAYIAEPPIATGNAAVDRAVVLRANQPDAARALFTAGAVVAAVAALDANTRRWDWTFYPAATAGMAEMRLECPGALRDAESLGAVEALLRAALEELVAADLIAG